MKREDAEDAKKPNEPDPVLDPYASHVISAAVEVHRVLGPGFLESVYDQALSAEHRQRHLPHRRQVPFSVEYKGFCVGECRLDFLVGERLVVEIKAVEALAPIHWVQVRSDLKTTGCVLGLLINFNEAVLLRGVRRVIQTP